MNHFQTTTNAQILTCQQTTKIVYDFKKVAIDKCVAQTTENTLVGLKWELSMVLYACPWLSS